MNWPRSTGIAALTARDLKARYRGSLLGFFWSLANPLLLLGVYTLVFTKFFPQQVVHPYPLFLFAGILPWTFFSAAVLESTNSISAQRRADQEGDVSRRGVAAGGGAVASGALRLGAADSAGRAGGVYADESGRGYVQRSGVAGADAFADDLRRRHRDGRLLRVGPSSATCATSSRT